MDGVGYNKGQLITYIGNKRKLICEIEPIIADLVDRVGGNTIITDLFSGTGAVSRMLKKYSKVLHVNDLELYSKITNKCYLSEDFNLIDISREIECVNSFAKELPIKDGVISELYAPEGENIKLGERVFYTTRNANFIDSCLFKIEEYPEDFKPFLLAPLIQKASVHTNTSGIFKGFHKGVDGVGKFGGRGGSALERICRDIILETPNLIKNGCEVIVHQEDANSLIDSLLNIDILYLDPPYNQHPYGSNYFMLNLIATNSFPDKISKVSGIPVDWNRSRYNYKSSALESLEYIVKSTSAKYVVLSYNSEGFITEEELKTMLLKYGKLETKCVGYSAYKGSRNFGGRDKSVTEFIFTLEKI